MQIQEILNIFFAAVFELSNEFFFNESIRKIEYIYEI